MPNRTYIQSDAPSEIGDNNAIAAYAQKYPVPAISLVEWEELHSDYKGITSGWNPDLPAGLPTVMDYDNGTCLVIVRVVRDNAAVEKRIAEIKTQIDKLKTESQWAIEKVKGDPTLKHYLADTKAKITALENQIKAVEGMGEK